MPAFRVLMLVFFLGINYALAAERVSRPGEYAGYSSVLYDGHQLSSQYVRVRDGTRLAVDIIRPTRNGAVIADPLPVVWMHTPYNRRRSNDGLVAEQYPGSAMGLVKYGYVVAVADMRGNYASFGKAVASNRNQWMPWAFWDAYDLTEWFAAQSWSTGSIGMWGCSATGHTQWQAAASKPPHLKAIFPLSAPSEYYDWGGVTPMLTETPPPPEYPGDIPAADARAVAVDEDRDGTLLAVAKEQHRGNLQPGYLPFRDSPSPWLPLVGLDNFKYHLEVNTFSHLRSIGQSGIPIYQSANFGEDQRAKLGVMIKQRNLPNPMKTLLAPDNHCVWKSDYHSRAKLNDINITTEELRWFDYWLKGVQNGIMDEPPIYFYTYHSTDNRGWQHAWQWPLPTTQARDYYFRSSAVATPAAGVNNGGLSTAAPTDAQAADQYTVDYSVTAADRNQKGLVYTSAALETDTTVIGHPIVRLWISSTATDGDFLAHLADVAPDGTVTPLPGTDDGQLRASHRKLNAAPYDNLGLPYHRSYAQDIQALVPGEPTELQFDMAPISWNFKAGHRIRLIITAVGIPRPGALPQTPVLSPAPIVTMHRNSVHSSRITLPAQAPIAATVKLSRRADRVQARVSFPATLDRRYLSDLKLDTVQCNGRAAASARITGRRLLTACDSHSIDADGALTIEGQFGRDYFYGSWARFVAVSQAPKAARHQRAP